MRLEELLFVLLWEPLQSSQKTPLLTLMSTSSIGGRVLKFIGSDHVWLQYSVLESSELKGANMRVEFYSRPDSVLSKTCGVHPIHKNEENGKDHPGVLHGHVNGHLDIPDEEMENSVDLLIHGFQLSKRRLDNEDHNLESNCNPQQKRLPVSTSIINFLVSHDIIMLEPPHRKI